MASSVFDMVKGIAENLYAHNETITNKELARGLNDLNVRNSRGALYSANNMRGIGKLVSSAWKYYFNKGDKDTADKIATTITNTNGDMPWYY